MSGIWERVKSSASERVSAHLLEAAMVFRGAGTFTAQQLLDGINATVTTPLDAAAQTDLTNIVAQLSAASGTANKLAYKETFKAALICAESGTINETTFRNVLGIA